jgi:hypothetical protein
MREIAKLWVSLRSDENALRLIVVMVYISVKIIKAIELYTFKVNCMVCELYLYKAILKKKT